MRDTAIGNGKVSIIMPVYNAEKYLKEAIDSVLTQTYRNIQLICVDDGSTDASLSLLAAYREQDSRVTVLTQENRHAGVARNNGMAYADGEFLMFLDSDDIFEKNMVETLVRQAYRDDAQIVICNYAVFEGDLKKRRKYAADMFPQKTVSALDIRDSLFHVRMSPPWNKLLRRDYVLATGFRYQELHVNNDVFFNRMIMTEAERISFTRESLLNYRVSNASSLQGKRKQYRFDFVRALSAVYDALQERGTLSVFSDAYYDWAYAWITEHLRDSDSYEAFAELADVLRKELLPKIGWNEKAEKKSSPRRAEMLHAMADGQYGESLFALYSYMKETTVPKQSAEVRVGQKVLKILPRRAMPSFLYRMLRKRFTTAK